MDIFCACRVGSGSVGILLRRADHSRGAKIKVAGHRHVDIEGSEVGEEFRVGVELMAIPFAVPEDSDLGEPLSGQQEVALVTRTGNDFGELRMKCDLESDLLVRRERV